jgi:hypothetical protein
VADPQRLHRSLHFRRAARKVGKHCATNFFTLFLSSEEGSEILELVFASERPHRNSKHAPHPWSQLEKVAVDILINNAAPSVNS